MLDLFVLISELLLGVMKAVSANLTARTLEPLCP